MVPHLFALLVRSLLFQSNFFFQSFSFLTKELESLSAALSVKMNILYFLPAFLYLSTLDQGLLKTGWSLATILLTQALISLPFTTYSASSYLSSAFDIHRVFLYKWTVNWRFLPEHFFLSPRLWLALLLAHISLLFVFFRKWSEPHGGPFRVLVRTFGSLSLPAALSKDRLDPSCEHYNFHAFLDAK